MPCVLLNSRWKALRARFWVKTIRTEKKTQPEMETIHQSILQFFDKTINNYRDRNNFMNKKKKLRRSVGNIHLYFCCFLCVRLVCWCVLVRLLVLFLLCLTFSPAHRQIILKDEDKMKWNCLFGENHSNQLIIECKWMKKKKSRANKCTRCFQWHFN